MLDSRGHPQTVEHFAHAGSCSGQTGGEEDYCEGSPLSNGTNLLHNADGQLYHRYWVDLMTWHMMTISRRNLTVRAFIDGKRQSDGSPAGTSGLEVILIDWIKVWNPAS